MEEKLEQNIHYKMGVKKDRGNKMMRRDWTNSRTLLWAIYLAKKAYYPLAISRL